MLDLFDKRELININFDVSLVGDSEKEQYIADAFGLGYATKKFDIYKSFKIDLSKQIYYFTGDSGSGKSILLGYIKERYKDSYIDFDDVQIDKEEKLYSICNDLNDSIRMLNMVGLGDAFLYLSQYKHISDGQRTRYKLLKCLLSDKNIIVVDEFLATLDRDTAKIVSYNLQRTLRKKFSNKKLFVATTHRDLNSYLRADILLTKLYGTEYTLDVRAKADEENPFVKHCRTTLSMQKGKDLWSKRFAQFHYRGHTISFLIDIALLDYKNEPIGIIVFKSATNKKNDIARISRVVLLPKFRGVGISHDFLRNSCRLIFDKYPNIRAVDTVAIMTHFNPFFEKAGFENIEYKPFDYIRELKTYLESKNINFYRFRIDKEYALNNIDSQSEALLRKTLEKRTRMYKKIDRDEEFKINEASINRLNIHQFLGALEIISPKKLIMTSEKFFSLA